LAGAGNNGEDGSEGAQVYNTFGCYLHGSLLPKNPHFADYLIAKALERRYGTVNLPPLDDTIERYAHLDVMIALRTCGAKIIVSAQKLQGAGTARAAP
jgi:CobQ-like glutamine amidotransferase family enzyme